MKGPRCDRILAGMTFAVTLVALFSAFQWGDLTAVPTGVSPAGQSPPTAPASGGSPAGGTISSQLPPTKPTGSVQCNRAERGTGPRGFARSRRPRGVEKRIRDLLGRQVGCEFFSATTPSTGSSKATGSGTTLCSLGWTEPVGFVRRNRNGRVASASDFALAGAV